MSDKNDKNDKAGSKLRGSGRITLAQGSALLGYRAPTTLRLAAEHGELRAEKVSSRLWLTTREEVLAWAKKHPRRQGGEGTEGSGRRGQPRRRIIRTDEDEDENEECA